MCARPLPRLHVRMRNLYICCSISVSQYTMNISVVFREFRVCIYICDSNNKQYIMSYLCANISVSYHNIRCPFDAAYPNDIIGTRKGKGRTDAVVSLNWQFGAKLFIFRPILPLHAMYITFLYLKCFGFHFERERFIIPLDSL